MAETSGSPLQLVLGFAAAPRTTELAATHISAITLEAELGWNFVTSSHSRIETVRPEVSLLCNPASVSTSGVPANQ